MASVNITLVALLNSLSSTYGSDAIRGELSAWLSSKPSSSSDPLPMKKGRKSKKDAVPSGASSVSSTEPKKERAPSAWNAFVDHVAGKKGAETDAFKTWLSSQVKDELSGNPKLKYASSVGKNADGSHTELYRTFAEQFKASTPAPTPVTAPSESAPTSTAAPSESAPAPTTDGEAAPKKRGRKPKTAEVVPSSADSTTSSQKKRGRPKGSKNKPKAPVLPESDSESESDSEEVSLTTLTIAGQDYYWNESTGDIYSRTDDGSLGDRLGSSTDGKSITFNTA